MKLSVILVVHEHDGEKVYRVDRMAQKESWFSVAKNALEENRRKYLAAHGMNWRTE